MKRKKQRTRNKNPCDGCSWGYVLNEEQVYCLMPRCVRGERKEAEDDRCGPGGGGNVRTGSAEAETAAEADNQ